MIDVKELMAKVGKIRILTNRLIDDQLSGDYHSTFKGQGVEFDEVRPYVAGDDVRAIDWNVTARTGAPYIKRYSEERELTVLFMVDVSGSQSYGSATRSKAELAAEVASLLALTAIRNQDKIGLILFSDRIVQYIPPRKGRQSVMRLVREVLAAEDDATGGTDIAGALRFLNGVQKRRAVVFLVSDFQAEGYEKELRVTARQRANCRAPVSPNWKTPRRASCYLWTPPTRGCAPRSPLPQRPTWKRAIGSSRATASTMCPWPRTNPIFKPSGRYSRGGPASDENDVVIF